MLPAPVLPPPVVPPPVLPAPVLPPPVVPPPVLPAPVLPPPVVPPPVLPAPVLPPPVVPPPVVPPPVFPPPVVPPPVAPPPVFPPPVVPPRCCRNPCYRCRSYPLRCCPRPRVPNAWLRQCLLRTSLPGAGVPECQHLRRRQGARSHIWSACPVRSPPGIRSPPWSQAPRRRACMSPANSRCSISLWWHRRRVSARALERRKDLISRFRRPQMGQCQWEPRSPSTRSPSRRKRSLCRPGRFPRHRFVC